MKKLFLVICLVFISTFSFAQDIKAITSDIADLKHKIEIMERDQINYQIEKDLLKETYSSNYQTINVVIAIVLGVFSIIGFLGLKSISSINKEYKNELENIRKMRFEFDNQIKESSKEQKQLKDRYTEITKINEEQTAKIKILEIQEKASNYISQRNYQRALSYLTIAYELNKKDTTILRLKAHCFWKTDQLANAISTYEELISADPTDTSAKVNILELYLLSDQIAKYEEKVKEYSIVFTEGNDLVERKIYFNVLAKYIKNETISVIINNYLEKLSNDEKKKRINWDFSDVKKYLSKKPQDLSNKQFVTFIELLEGEKTKSEYLSISS